ncbi:MAG TPA: ABC transporter permease [Patescibacteria group bacterium]|jgi:ABC-2 type transport system permease protein|nr:ABC transporter permease [Patescibacteria group bacterium]
MNTDVQQYLDLLWGMTEKELRVRYKYTFFGFLWIVVNPLLQMFLIGFLLSLFIKQSSEQYYFHLYTSLLVWNFFSLSLVKATPSIVAERFLIKKSMFPRSVIPLSIVLSNVIHLLLGMGLFGIVMMILKMMPGGSLLYILFGLCLLIIFTCGFCLLTSALNVRFRDIKFIIEALLVLWFYATPVIYTFSLIPQKYIWIWRLNPMTSIMQLFQYGFINAPPPGPAMLSINLIIIVIVAFAGIRVFRSESSNFDDWV